MKTWVYQAGHCNRTGLNSWDVVGRGSSIEEARANLWKELLKYQKKHYPNDPMGAFHMKQNLGRYVESRYEEVA